MSSPPVPDDQAPDYDEPEIIAEGIASTVSRAWASVDDGEPQWLVLKTATTKKRFSKEPHDILKELRIVSALDHPNIIAIVDHFRDKEEGTMNLWMPYIPQALTDLLRSPRFTPHPTPFPELERDLTVFETITKSLVYQVLQAMAYLHGKGIAHRDIKPHNVLLTYDGLVKVIDFGIVWKSGESPEEQKRDLWPETSERMYFEVSTGPYRAPELLFGTRSYDAIAIDMWSFGALLAEFFTPLRLVSDDDFDSPTPSPAAQDSEELQPYIILDGLQPGRPGTSWHRDTLFDGTRGEIGLAWSIFKVFGTPTEESWPGFKELPDAQRVEFMMTPSVELASRLPNLPAVPSPALDLLEKILVYPPQKRLRAHVALESVWFDAVVVPPNRQPRQSTGSTRIKEELEGNTLGELLLLALS